MVSYNKLPWLMSEPPDISHYYSRQVYTNFANFAILFRTLQHFAIKISFLLRSIMRIFHSIPELQKSCGYAGITREEGLPYVRSVRKV